MSIMSNNVEIRDSHTEVQEAPMFIRCLISCVVGDVACDVQMHNVPRKRASSLVFCGSRGHFRPPTHYEEFLLYRSIVEWPCDVRRYNL